jgi:hypothetical protein
VASGDYAVAEGYQTSATSNYSHAEGYSTKASGYYSHAEGNSTTASGYNSHVEGGGTTASGPQSHAEGGGTKAYGTNSHAEGGGTTASGECSHAEGQGTQAIGSQSHAEGGGTQANGAYSHAEGLRTTASGNSSHAEGQYTTASGSYSHAEGNTTTASGESSHAEGTGTIASGPQSHTEGGGTTASGICAHAEGYNAKASGQYSHSEGSSTEANGFASHAEGYSTKASGYASHAEGFNVQASGRYSHAEGGGTKSYGDYSHAEGQESKAYGDYSHAEGFFTKANGYYSHAEGNGTNASGASSHAEGSSTIANNQSEHASGQYNVSSTASTEFGNSGNTLFSVGNGTANDARHNAFEIRQNGDIYIVNKNGQDVKLQDEIGNIDVDQTIDSGTSASTNAVSTSAVYGFVTSYTPSITVDQVLDDTTSASTNPVSSKAVYKAATDNELVWTNAFVALSGTVSAHTEDTTIHVTSTDKTKWNAVDNKLNTSDFNTYSGAVDTVIGSKAAQSDLNALSGTVTRHTADTTIHLTSTEKGQLHTHSNKSALDAITGNVGTMAYEDKASYSSATEVNTALGNKANATDLANFFDDAKYEDSGSTKVINFYHENTIKATIDASDFIVDGMVEDVRIENGNLVVDFNTASGKQDISIPLTDIFDPSNYYNKTAIDNLVGSGFTSSSITDVIIENEEIVSEALTDLDERKLDASAYTPVDLSNYYTKSETSGATEISTALSGYATKSVDLDGVVLKKITQSAYDALVQAGTVDPNTLYIITD